MTAASAPIRDIDLRIYISYAFDHYAEELMEERRAKCDETPLINWDLSFLWPNYERMTLDVVYALEDGTEIIGEPFTAEELEDWFEGCLEDE